MQIQITMISHLKLDIQVDCWPKVVEADESVARDVDPVFHDTVSHLRSYDDLMLYTILMNMMK